jgi:hypothetical protein
MAPVCLDEPIEDDDQADDNADDTDVSTDVDDMSPEIGCCSDCPMCAYGTGVGETGTCTVFMCTKEDCDIYVCHKCFDAGGHIRHKDYMVLVKPDD